MLKTKTEMEEQPEERLKYEEEEEKGKEDDEEGEKKGTLEHRAERKMDSPGRQPRQSKSDRDA